MERAYFLSTFAQGFGGGLTELAVEKHRFKCVNDLPDSVLVNVAEFLDPPSGLFGLSLASKKIKRLLDDKIMLQMCADRLISSTRTPAEGSAHFRKLTCKVRALLSRPHDPPVKLLLDNLLPRTIDNIEAEKLRNSTAYSTKITFSTHIVSLLVDTTEVDRLASVVDAGTNTPVLPRLLSALKSLLFSRQLQLEWWVVSILRKIARSPKLLLDVNRSGIVYSLVRYVRECWQRRPNGPDPSPFANTCILDCWALLCALCKVNRTEPDTVNLGVVWPLLQEILFDRDIFPETKILCVHGDTLHFPRRQYPDCNRIGTLREA